MNLWGALIFATIVSLFFQRWRRRTARRSDFLRCERFRARDGLHHSICRLFPRQRDTGTHVALFAIVALVMILTAIVKSGSRGGFIGLIAVRALRPPSLSRDSGSRATCWLPSRVLSLFLGFASDKYWTMMSTILHPTKDYNYTDSEGRVEVWKRGMGYMLHNPVVGVGVAAYPIAEGGSDLAQSQAAQGQGLQVVGRAQFLPRDRRGARHSRTRRVHRDAYRHEQGIDTSLAARTICAMDRHGARWRLRKC